jgi:predicted small secreted protein
MEVFMFKRIAGLILIAMALAGCNTMSGMGRDIERGGEKLQDQAHETQQEMRR